MKKIEAIGFDFDDTLVLSEEEKLNIVEEIFDKKFGMSAGVMRRYKSLLGKASRDEKLAILIKEIYKKEPSEKDISDLSYAFGKGYEYKLSHCPLLQCTNILKELKEQVKVMFMLSLEDRKQVVSVAKHCGISGFFHEILGGPAPKVDNFKYIMEKYHIDPAEIIYIGDSKGDIVISQKLEIKSIGIHWDQSHREILDKLGADFTFSNLCEIPFEQMMHR